MKIFDLSIDSLIRLALAEDIGSGDKTTGLLVDGQARGRARVIAKEDLVAAGFVPFERVFAFLSASVVCRFLKEEGSVVLKGETLAELDGPFATLLTGERTALNFMQRLCGIATLTRQYAEKLKPYKAVLLDTRKTTPGWRVLEKEAVRYGGGTNHRMGLFDALLIKENHIAACGGITAAVAKARSQLSPLLSVEVEVRNFSELQEALAASPDVIMLDNMSLEDMKKAAELTSGRVPLEASGNVTLDTLAAIAKTGVDFISSGALTHSARAVDISMLIEKI
ncbi:MAG: carboxylating nicotinate-nucleotide diphosphorylase [Deltaproteobacteria bacterium]|nr:carboxylating nicotinate-nucleotide diphosphorylase [Deltaproteobacteria bacterium]